MNEISEANLRQLAERAKQTQEALDDCVRRMVECGESFTKMAAVLGVTEAAVRIKAKRRGWSRR